MFKVEIETENAAFHPIDSSFPVEEAEELGDILTRIVAKMRDGKREGVVRDFNGNICGGWTLS